MYGLYVSNTCVKDYNTNTGLNQWESLRFSENSLNLSQEGTTEFFQWCYTDWKSVIFHWILETFTDSNFERQVGKFALLMRANSVQGRRELQSPYSNRATIISWVNVRAIPGNKLKLGSWQSRFLLVRLYPHSYKVLSVQKVLSGSNRAGRPYRENTLAIAFLHDQNLTIPFGLIEP